MWLENLLRRLLSKPAAVNDESVALEAELNRHIGLAKMKSLLAEWEIPTPVRLDMDQSCSKFNSIVRNLRNAPAIYHEGNMVLAVEVKDIKMGPAFNVTANILVQPARGLPQDPERFAIATDLRFCSIDQSHWQMGYGGWTLFFDPQFVSELLGVAAKYREGVDYRQDDEKRARLNNPRFTSRNIPGPLNQQIFKLLQDVWTRDARRTLDQ